MCDLRKLDIHREKELTKLDPCVIPHQKNYAKWFRDLNVKRQIFKYSQGNRIIHSDFWATEGSEGYNLFNKIQNC